MPNLSSDSIPSTEELTEEARHLAEEQKVRGAERIGRVAQAVHSAASGLEADLPQAAGYIHEAADRLQQTATALRQQSIEDIVTQINGFARRQPVAFFGGSVLAGFVLARFLKSTAAPHQAVKVSDDATDGSFPPKRERVVEGGD